MPHRHAPCRPDVADRDLVVELGNGALTFYRAGDATASATGTPGRPRLDPALDAESVVVGASRAKRRKATPGDKADTA